MHEGPDPVQRDRWLALLPGLALAGLAAAFTYHALDRIDGPVYALDQIDKRIGTLSYWHQKMAIAIPAVLAGLSALTAVGCVAGWPWARRAGRGILAGAAVLAALWSYRSNDFLAAIVLVALLAAWVHLCVPSLAHHATEARFSGTPLGRGIAAWRRLLERTVGRAPMASLGLAAIALGVAARCASPWMMDFWADGNTYAAMGHMWSETNRLLMPYGESNTVPPMDPQPSHHYPPLYPIVLGLGYKALGFGLWQTKLMAVALSLGALATTFWTTRDLYGRDAGLFVTGLVALEPHLLWATGTNFSENLVVILFAVTMWAILKSLDHQAWIVVAGAAAGLAYLTRSSIGAFFLVAGIAGFLWRFLYLRWSVLRNRHYLAAIAVFLGLALTWASRNVRLFGGWPAWESPAAVGIEDAFATALGSAGARFGFVVTVLVAAGIGWLGRPAHRLGAPRPDGPLRGGRYWALVGAGTLLALWVVAYLAHNLILHGEPSWHTSAYTQDAIAFAFDDLAQLRVALFYKTFFFLLFLLPFALLLWPEFRTGARNALQEPVSALWLAIGLVYVIGLIMASVFWVREQSTIFWFDNHRYVVIAVIPIGWLVARHADFKAPSFRWRAAGTYLVLAGLMFTVAFAPVRHMEDRAAEALEGRLEPGMEVGYEGAVNKYATYAYLPEHDISVYIVWRDKATGALHGGNPDYIITKTRDDDWSRITYRDYVEVGAWRQSYWNGERLVGQLWQRADLHAAETAAAA